MDISLGISGDRNHRAALLREALTDAAAEGYNVAGFSGGESILYKELPDILDHAHARGFTTTVTSNGMLLDEKRLDVLRGRVDVLAISIDGVPASHNRVRACAHAFASMISHLNEVRASGIPFGLMIRFLSDRGLADSWRQRIYSEIGTRMRLQGGSSSIAIARFDQQRSAAHCSFRLRRFPALIKIFRATHQIVDNILPCRSSVPGICKHVVEELGKHSTVSDAFSIVVPTFRCAPTNNFHVHRGLSLAVGRRRENRVVAGDARGGLG